MGESPDVLHGLFHGQDAACQGAICQGGPAVLYEYLLTAQLAFSFAQQAGPHGIGDEHDFVQTFGTDRQTKSGRVDVDAIGDELAGHRLGEGCPHQSGPAMVQGTHGVVQVGDVAGPGRNGPGGLFESGIAVAQGDDDPVAAAAGDEFHVRQGLRRQGQDFQDIRIGFDEVPAGFPDVTGFLGSLVCFTDERAFQVGAQDVRSRFMAPGLPDGREGFSDGFLAAGHGGGQKACDPGGGLEPAHGGEGLPGAVHGIAASAAVDVEVQEPGSHVGPSGIDDLGMGRQLVRV